MKTQKIIETVNQMIENAKIAESAQLAAHTETQAALAEVETYHADRELIAQRDELAQRTEHLKEDIASYKGEYELMARYAAQDAEAAKLARKAKGEWDRLDAELQDVSAALTLLDEYLQPSPAPLSLREKCLAQAATQNRLAEEAYDVMRRATGARWEYQNLLYGNALTSAAAWRTRAEKVDDMPFVSLPRPVAIATTMPVLPPSAPQFPPELLEDAACFAAETLHREFYLVAGVFESDDGLSAVADIVSDMSGKDRDEDANVEISERIEMKVKKAFGGVTPRIDVMSTQIRIAA